MTIEAYKIECVIFYVNGIEYRTNADASVVERNDGPKLGWNRTGSLGIRTEALKALVYLY